MDYVEKWRMILWEKAFMEVVHPSVKPPFVKGSSFDNLEKADHITQWLLYRFGLILEFIALSTSVPHFLM
jgi:hypothetical protein